MSSPLKGSANPRPAGVVRTPPGIEVKSGRPPPGWQGAPAIPAWAIWGGLNMLALLLCCHGLMRAVPIRLTALEIYISTVCVSFLNVSAWQFLRLAGKTEHVRPQSARLRFWGALVLSLNPLLVLAAWSTSAGPFYATCLAIFLAMASSAILWQNGPTARIAASAAFADHPNSRKTSFQRLRIESAFRLRQCEDDVPAGPFPRLAEILDHPVNGSAGVPASSGSSSIRVHAPKQVDASSEVPATEQDPLHWMSRTADADGAEHLQGGTVVDFASGQKQAIVHVAFCPPFTGTPEIECDSDDDDACRLKVAAVYPYGVRIELKRAESAAPARVRIRYAACGSSAGTR